MGGLTVPPVFAPLDVDYEALYFELDGTFPNHDANPIDSENLRDLQAAVGIVQLGRLPEMIARRRELAAAYAEVVRDLPGLRLVEDPAWGTTNFQSCWLEVLPEHPLGREELMAHLAAAGISARCGIMAAHRQPAYAGRDTGGIPMPVTEHLTDNTLILPLFHQMSESEQARVIDVLRAGSRVG